MSIRKYQPEHIGRTPSTAIAIIVGHLPRYVYVDGGNFNAVLVREGSPAYSEKDCGKGSLERVGLHNRTISCHLAMVFASDTELLRSPRSLRPVSTVPHRVGGRWRA